MKYNWILGLIVLLISCSQQEDAHDLYGKWKLTFKSGPLAEVRFQRNGTHDYYMKGKLFSSGKSVFSNDTLRTYDPICGNGEYYGTYKIDFLGGDSIRFKAIDDRCDPRRFDMDGTVLHRVKKD